VAAAAPGNPPILHRRVPLETVNLSRGGWGGGHPRPQQESGMDTSLPVLVVDDSRTMAAIIVKLVREVGFTNVYQVNDGHSALERLREKKYHLVFSDWDMRPMNGTELIAQIRMDPVNASTPVIMITAKCDADVSWLSGADGYLMKPFKAGDLNDKIEEVLSQRVDDFKRVG
jgi:two-component system, chemotaxis family, chemotaxis protein CheY